MFALASVTALGGLVAAVSAAGCTTTETVVQQTADSGVADAGKRDAKPPVVEENDAEPPEDTCKTTGAKFEPNVVKPPKTPNTTACSQDVLTALANACFKAPSGNDCAAARQVAANKACADCIFSLKTDPEWGAIVLDPEPNKPGLYNQAGCLDHATGIPDCGKNVLDVLACFDHYCGKCPSDSAEEEACQEEVREGECMKYLISSQCLDAVQAKQDKCFPAAQTEAAYKQFFINIASVFCAAQSAGGNPDGG